MRPIKLTGPRQRQYAKTLIDGVPDGYIVRIAEPTRTLDQNAKLWALLTDLSRQVEWPVDGKLQKLTPDDWKDIMTASLKREQRVAAGADGGFVILGRRTSTMGTREFSDLVEFILAFGATRDPQVVWSEPHPDERAA